MEDQEHARKLALFDTIRRIVTIIVIGLLAWGFVYWMRAPRMQKDRYTKDGRLIINYWEKWTGFEGEAMQAVVDDFNASQDKYFVKRLTVSTIDRKLMLAAAGGNPPDVSGLWSHNICTFAEKGALMPLDKMLEKAGITRDRYIPVFWDLCKHRGFMWALPSTPASVALHWNKKMFREAGLDPERPPQSLEELDRMAEQLTIVEVVRNGESVRVRFPELTEEEREAKEFKLVELGHTPSEPGWWSPFWPFWFGGRLWNGERKITANSPEVVEAFEWMQTYPEKYGLENMRTFGASFGNFASPQNPFLSGQVAMEIQGVWMYNFIDKYAPTLEWGAAPFPSKYPDRLPMVTLAECDTLVIPKGSPHPEGAFEFIKYVNTQKPMEKLNLAQRKFSPLKKLSPDFISKHPNPEIEVFIELAHSENARYASRLSLLNEYLDEMRVAVDQVMNLINEPEPALDAVQKRVQWRFDRIMRRWDMVEDERLEEWRQ